jgi:hypothetical protein
MSSFRIVLCSTVCLAAPAIANADGPGTDTEPRMLFGHPVNDPPEPSPEEFERRRQAFEQSLIDNHEVLSDDQVIPRAVLDAPPIPGSTEAPGEWDEPPHFSTIFLNFFGGPMTYGTNAAEMQSACVRGGDVEYPGFKGSESLALAIIQIFQNAMEPYAVRIAYEKAPPKHLPYAMLMMGGKPQDLGMGAGVLGVSCANDCGDRWWRDATFAFTDQTANPGTMGTTALQEAAHALGLDHIDGQNHIMYPYASGGSPVWADQCTPYNDATGGISCKAVHDVFCGEGAGMQNDHAELLAFFGPNVVDMEPPTVTLIEPQDGTMLEPGASVNIVAEVSDNHEGYGWRLVIRSGDQEQIINAYVFQKEWTLDNLPQGTYAIRVEAVDHDLNEGFAEATVYVGEEPGADDGGTDGTSGTDSDADPTTGGGSTGDGGDDTQGEDDDADQADSGGGCSVAAPTVPTFAGGLLLVMFGGLARRRR